MIALDFSQWAEIRSWNAENDEYWESVEYICY